MRTIAPICSLLLLVLPALSHAQNTTPAPAALPRTASPAGATEYFIAPQNGAKVTSPFTVRFGLKGMGVAPAGVTNANTGHHHLLIDTKLPDLNKPIPSDFNHLHFGAGQTEAEITLTPGYHTLQLLLGDQDHVPHNPPIMSKPIRVLVTRTGR